MPEIDRTQMEADFLSAKEDKLGIYQLKHDDSLRDIQFEGMDWLKSHGKEVEKDNYELTYTMDLQPDMDLERIYEIFNMDHPADFRGHSLSVSDMVVLHQDGDNSCHFVDRFGFTEIPDFLTREAEREQATEMAVQVGFMYVSIHECDEGYDYTAYKPDFTEWDGGVYDDPDVSIADVLNEVIAEVKEKFGITDEPVEIDYAELEEKTELAEQNRLKQEQAHFVENEGDEVTKFKARTEELFHSIEEMHPEEIEALVYVHVQEIIDTYDMDAKIECIAITGSRARGIEEAGSDLDVVVEISGGEREDVLFDAFNEDPIILGGIKVDINPITAEKTGTLETYLPQVEDYLQEKARQMQQEITYYVACCSEFHSFAPVYEGFTEAQDAIDKYNEIYPIYASNIPAIGVKIHNFGDEPEMDTEWDVLVGGRMDLDMLGYIGDMTANDRAMDMIADLASKMPEIEVWGECPGYSAAVDRQKDAAIWKLAEEIDQFSEDMFPYEYMDNVEDKLANIQSIADDLRAGNVEYMEKFLKAAVADYVAEGLQDIVVSDTSDIGTVQAVGNIRKAEELVQRLEDYKPLAKVEEIEEQNYNMIDNRLNNGFGEKQRKEEDKKVEHVEEKHERVSIKLKLEQKKAEIAKKNAPPPEPEKKHQREIK